MSGPVICVVGSGTAGLEGLLLARELLGPEAVLRLIAPEPEFRYRPMSSASLFRPAAERSLRIADIASTADATWIADRAAFIDDEQGTVLTRDGDTVPYDYLLLAAGARSTRALRQGFVWARGGDPSFLDQIIGELAAGTVRSVAVVVPRGARWPLPAYELALVLAWTSGPAEADITVITAEERPLAALGADAADAVTRELAAAGAKMRVGVEALDDATGQTSPPRSVELVLVPEEDSDAADALVGKPTGVARLRLDGSSAVQFDRLISLPTVLGPFIAGVPTDAAGFVEVDESLHVCGSARAWAAGGCIAAALEHSALAARQADAAVAAIAERAAGDAEPPASRSGVPELTGLLLSGQRERWLAENPAGTHEPSTRCLWWPPGRAVGKMLARQIAAWDLSVGDVLPTSPGGLAIRAPVALGCSDRSAVGRGAVDRAARVRDIENRQIMAIRRRAREAEAELASLRARLDTLTASQQQVIRELQQHGYLRGRSDT